MEKIVIEGTLSVDLDESGNLDEINIDDNNILPALQWFDEDSVRLTIEKILPGRK